MRGIVFIRRYPERFGVRAAPGKLEPRQQFGIELREIVGFDIDADLFFLARSSTRERSERLSPVTRGSAVSPVTVILKVSVSSSLP